MYGMLFISYRSGLKRKSDFGARVSKDRMLPRFEVVSIVLGLILMPIQSAHAQAANGTISGKARDTSGSVVPDAPIKLPEIRTNQEFADKTDQHEFYTSLNLMSGSATRLNGGRPRANKYLYDGISVLQPEPG